jgi:hypothetical protein
MSDDVGPPKSVSFRYNDEQRQEILQCFRYSAPPEDLISYLERGAILYRFSAALTAGAFGERNSKTAKQLMKGVEQTISSLKNLSAEWTWEHLGHTNESSEHLLEELEAIHSAAKRLADLSDGGMFTGRASSKKNKMDRRAFIEHATSIWVAYSDDPALKTKTATTTMLDYLCAAVNPVLVGNDRFNSFQEAGRDALRKVVENICDEGLRFGPMYLAFYDEDAENILKRTVWAKIVGNLLRKKGERGLWKFERSNFPYVSFAFPGRLRSYASIKGGSIDTTVSNRR